jgi:hypothetical protein
VTPPMTPEQEEQVRRALAAAARAEDAEIRPTIPPAVAARLDDVLADLVQGRAAPPVGVDARSPGSRTDQLAARRARKRLNVLVAAAAVAVIAAAGATVARGGLGGSGSADSSAASSSQTGVARTEGPPPKSETTAPSPGSSGSDSGGRTGFSAVDEPLLRTSSLASDVRRVARSLAGTETGTGRERRTTSERPDGARCERPSVPGAADVLAVRLDGAPATLVLLREVGGTREARVYSCADGSTPVVTTSVPAR